MKARQYNLLSGAENSIGGLLDENHLIVCGGFNVNVTNECNFLTTREDGVSSGTGVNQKTELKNKLIFSKMHK